MRRRLALRAALAILSLSGASCAGGGPAPPRLLTLEGRAVDPFADLRGRIAVFLFTRTDCPISNRYAPEVRRLYGRFADRGVSFRLVYVDPAQGPDEIRSHVDEYGYPMPALRDPGHALVALAGVRVTPEAAVFASSGKERELVYRGRIDDWYVDFGKRREPSSHDLEVALESLLAGRAVPRARTRAVGCFIADLS